MQRAHAAAEYLSQGRRGKPNTEDTRTREESQGTYKTTMNIIIVYGGPLESYNLEPPLVQELEGVPQKDPKEKSTGTRRYTNGSS